MGRTSDSRQRLMDAAHDLIWNYSYGSVTIEAICEKASVKKGSFYYFFDSKPDLAVAAVEAWWTERQVALRDIFRDDVAPLDRMIHYIEFIVKRQIASYESDGRVLGCPLFTLATEISSQDEQLRTSVRQILDHMTALFTKAVQEAQERGDIPGRDHEVKMRLLWSFYEGTLARARIENNPQLLRDLVPDVLELLGAPKAALAA